jgi:hypothetical protein
MTESWIFIKDLDPRRRAYIIGAAAACLVAATPFAEDLPAYLYVAVPALAPLLVWLLAGAPGIPVLPAISGLFVIYYALPLLRTEMAAFGPQELQSAGLAVGSFLVAATIGSLPFLQRTRRHRAATQSFASGEQVVFVVFVGLAGGIIYNLANMMGYVTLVGASASVLRSVATTLSSVACYLLGSARGSGLLVGQRWLVALSCLCMLVALSLGNLFLIGGLTNLLAAVFGYVFTSKRVPWKTLVVAFVIASILHAGKKEMRLIYWQPHSQSLRETSVLQVPGMIAEWFSLGVATIGTDSRDADVLERASLLHMVLLVQRATPSDIPYLDGETYALLPSMLVPRFLEPEKIQSQAVLNLLSVRYHLQTAEATANTTIGWGMVAEAWANYGFTGIIGVGFLFGAFCGFLMRLSIGAAALSVPMFVTIAATLTLVNVEMDFSYLTVTLAQTVATVLILSLVSRVLPRRGRPSRATNAVEHVAGRSSLRDPHGA